MEREFLKSQSSSQPLCSIVFFVDCLWLEAELLGDKKSGSRSSSVQTALHEKPEC